MMVAIVPKLLEIFEDKSALPASTKILIAVSDFLADYWIFLII
jgi:type II secretory pathway component PulF